MCTKQVMQNLMDQYGICILIALFLIQYLLTNAEIIAKNVIVLTVNTVSLKVGLVRVAQWFQMHFIFIQLMGK